MAEGATTEEKRPPPSSSPPHLRPASLAQLKRPISGGPPFAAYAAILCASVYVVLLRDPTGATAAFLRAAGLPPVLPLGGDFAHSLALLCMLTVPLQNRSVIPQPAVARRISETLARWLPGFRPVFVPSEIGATGSTRGPGVLHADAFGYERHEEDDDPAIAVALASAREGAGGAAFPVAQGREARHDVDAGGVQADLAVAGASGSGPGRAQQRGGAGFSLVLGGAQPPARRVVDDNGKDA